MMRYKIENRKNKIYISNIKKGKSQKLVLFTFFLAVFIFSCSSGRQAFLFFNLGVKAQEMKSQNFKIQGGNFNITSGSKASQSFKLSDVVGETAAGVFASKGYLLQSGFLNGSSGVAFSFSVSPTLLDFGTLLPNIPVERAIRITIANSNVPGYTVRVSEDQPLSTAVGAEIPDTICDSQEKNPPCTISSASKWEKNTTFGLGYKIEGKTAPVDFKKENYFRPFPAQKRGEEPVIIMQGAAKKVVDQATMTLRVNIDRTQPVGQYRNVISFTAVGGI